MPKERLRQPALLLGIDTAHNSKSSHSGPYSDISIAEESGGTGCVNIAPQAQPRGIHGINCNSSSNAGAGIYLDGSNVSVEDVNVNGFVDGIRIGSQVAVPANNAQSNVIFNVTGGSGLTDVVHICASGSSNCSTTSTVTDLTLLGITRTANNSIQDDVTGNTLSDATVGMYILGESVTVGSNTGYSRFTTSPSIPTWRVGAAKPPIGNCAIGTLYSRTSNSSTTPPTVYGCTGPTTWTPIL